MLRPPPPPKKKILFAPVLNHTTQIEMKSPSHIIDMFSHDWVELLDKMYV